MGVVRIVTDSTADMEESEAGSLGIEVVPLTVHWNGDSYLDKIEMSIDDFYRKLQEGPGTPMTSQPSAGQFEELYRRLTEGDGEVLSLHISGKLSGTLNSAQVAAETVGMGRILPLDTRTTTFALGWIATSTARLAASGASLQECASFAADMLPRIRLYFMVDTLEYLRRGGRIGRAQAIAGSILSLKPILQLADGEVIPLDKVRTRAAALGRMAQIIGDLGPLSRLAILHGDQKAPADQLEELVKHASPEIAVERGRIGPVLGTHTGPGVVGACALLPR